MHFSTILSASAVLGFSFASNIHRKHEELHTKRHANLLERHTSEESANSTCGCTTIWSTIYGEPTLIQPDSYGNMTASSSSATSTSVREVTSAPEIPTASPMPIQDTPAHPPKPVKPSHPEVANPAPPAKQSADDAKPKKPSHSGSHWAMTYSPYTPSGLCKASSDVASDVASIAAKGFSSIRLYSTDCSGLTNVATAAQSHNLNLILGVYISASGISAAQPQIDEIVSWAANNGHWKGVEMIVVGNEAVFNSFASAEELASFVSEARSAFKSGGYDGPVTLTETVDILSKHAEVLCPASDIAAANIHAFFNGQVTASGAGAFVASQLELLAETCPGKEVYNLETGWPSKGSKNGVAIPGSWEQRIAVEGIRKLAGGKSTFFSFVDDEWKEEGEWGVERSWGCGQLFD